METQIEVIFKGSKLKGILIRETENILTLKLSSGYNSNLKKSQVKEISRETLELEQIKTNSIEIKKKSSLPKIAILHTGGTIASKVDYETGAVTSRSTPEELLALYPELSKLVNIEPEMIGNILSGDLNIAHWNVILKSIEEKLKDKNLSGIIISHGTDTLSYSAPALQYAIKNLSIPVILVGSQRSSDRPGADAYLNLTRAVEFIIKQSKEKEQFRRVGVSMYSSINDGEVTIFDAINVKKAHSSRRDAFKQINYSPFAIIGENSYVEVRPELKSLILKEKPIVSYFNEDIKIGIFKTHPSLRPKELEMLSYYDAVIIEGTGMGNLHVNKVDDITKFGPGNLNALKNLQKTTKVVMLSQTGSGMTALNVYSYGVKIKETGVLGNFMNLISESLYSRLVFCLSSKSNFEEIWESQLEGFNLITLDVEEKEK